MEMGGDRLVEIGRPHNDDFPAVSQSTGGEHHDNKEQLYKRSGAVNSTDCNTSGINKLSIYPRFEAFGRTESTGLVATREQADEV
jgi:hypothetical protein